MVDEAAWGAHLAALGHEEVAPFASGMDGVLFRLGDGLVAKVWRSRTAAQLEPLAAFLDDVAHGGLPFGTPRLLDIGTGPGGLAWTLGPELDGAPLTDEPPGVSPRLTPRRLEALLDVLSALAEVAPSPGTAGLPVLAEDRPLLAGHRCFADALAALVRRRVAVSAAALAPRVPDVSALAEQVCGALTALDVDEQATGLVHGDLFGPNVLVDEEGDPSAVLDFGFLSTVGDPAFDAAVTGAIWDMYGPAAARTRELLDEALAERFAHPPERLALYRLAYALVTATVYDPTGSDGHARWCTGLLTGPDVAAAQLSGSR